jgi:predicted O-methyltransferase YrrM
MICGFKNSMSVILEGFRYFVLAKYRNGHGVHSPVVYDLVRNVIGDKQKYDDYKKIEQYILELKTDTTSLKYAEMGGGSHTFSKGHRKVNELARISGVHKKYGRLLYRMVAYYKPWVVLELGTSIGISTMYMALGNNTSSIHTIEGNKALSDFASECAGNLNLKNIQFYQANFDEVLPSILDGIEMPSLVFIDGNHTYDASMRYFELISEKMKNGIIVFDDIYWSKGMRKAWKEIVREADVTIDLFQFGMVVIGDMLTPGYYRVRF